MAEEDSKTESDIGWYVSDVHCMRAIGYLTVDLIQGGHLDSNFKMSVMVKKWGEALAETMVPSEPSPIGPDLERAQEILRGD